MGHGKDAQKDKGSERMNTWLWLGKDASGCRLGYLSEGNRDLVGNNRETRAKDSFETPVWRETEQGGLGGGTQRAQLAGSVAVWLGSGGM